ncbi:phosphoribosylglycinamide formyltransferase [Planctobacterium marinum]|uniref:phosphoribosylglycinamide formyltransferase n=1 Tax=Planctobacterium marinum TaxID=1631968 RepID=UPI001E28545F|nr:phosphoribosylglycinamide formyltransferase [Planctobacterium marinum]MCC2604170.1 phosphoribosylglycinamide formyltransferase [Planctobacterium marinum]
MKRIVVLISGSGSNLQAIIDATESNQIPGQVVAVISNKADAYGLTRAKQHNIAHQVIDHKAFPDRESFDAKLQEVIDAFNPDVVVLAGFMRILTQQFVEHFTGKLINIHPSLLPKFKGLDTHQRALDAKESYHGASVHFVTPELDGGPVIVQGPVAILAEDNVDSLKAKVHKIEHQIYPYAVKLICEDKITMTAEGVHYQQQQLPETGLVHEV